MTSLVWLVPMALGMGIVGLLAFLWSLHNGQYDDLDGAAERVLLDQKEDHPIIDSVGHRCSEEDVESRLS
ncbi:cytochrome C oxidase Cbb3 [Methyloceanibacter marginalis]|uniref:Cytochrome C oxidase Cbb3 n=1 Tax=Methyloceanibacter marginalis TaxID=1774971 RepID=A0A1E3WAU9_9HYPH|nr:cbb3-type cytochrome oxidase assembly protein CcoS [Methyloceanibacter marginalis]ODS02916.1 cytochrome C oxidase Cbb3 [Methyloceanibacter marginalis]